MNTDIHFKLKVAFCFAIVLCLYTLALVVALGSVKADTSDGLSDIIHVFEILAAGASTWLFNHRPTDGANGDTPEPVTAPAPHVPL